MKKIISIIMFLCLMPIASRAQEADPRQLTNKDIISDALGKMPAQDKNEFNLLMTKICETGPDGISQLIEMMTFPGDSTNAKIEYAIEGLAGFVSTKEGSKFKDLFREALMVSLEKCPNVYNKRFLISKSACYGTEKEIMFIREYLDNDTLTETVIKAIASIPNSDGMILKLTMIDKYPRYAVAEAVGMQKVAKAESKLIEWTDGADEKTLNSIYWALSEIGTKEKALPVLEKAAKKVKFGFDETNATHDYLCLLDKMAAQKDTAVIDNAAKLMKKTKNISAKVSLMQIYATLYGKGAMPYLIKGVNDKNSQIRNAALEIIADFAENEEYQTVVDAVKNDKERIDVLRWLGEQHAYSQLDYIISQYESKNVAVVEAAVTAAGNIGNTKALGSFLPLMGGKHNEIVEKTLLSFTFKQKMQDLNNPGKFKYNKVSNGLGALDYLLPKALNGNENQQVAALNILAKRYSTSMPVKTKVFELLNSNNQEIKENAYKALVGVCTIKDMDELREHLVNDDVKYVPYIQDALVKIVKANEDEKAIRQSLINRISSYPADIQARFKPIATAKEQRL